jgi:hypothetical protein
LRLLFTALCGLVLPVAAADEAEGYEVRIERSSKAGDRYKMSAKVTVDSETKTTVEGGESEEVKVNASCRLLAEYTAVAVTKRGAPKEVRLKVLEAECMEDGKKASFFKAGDVIHMHVEDDEYVTEINGEEPDSVQSEVLDALIYLSDEDDATEDEMFGTKEKVKVGAQWKMNREALVADWARDGFEGLKVEDMEGGTSFSEMTEIGGKPALRLKGAFKIEAKDVTMPSLPEGMKAKRYMVSVTDELDSPVDVTSVDARVKMDYKSETEAEGKIEYEGDEKVNTVIKMKRRFTIEMAETALK